MKQNSNFRSYNQVIGSLNDNILEMGNKVVELIALSYKAISDFDANLLADARKKDLEINDLETKIEKQVTKIMASRQPMANDLRFVISSIKISGLFERMGDRAKGAIRYATKIESEIDEKIVADLQKMHKILTHMMAEILATLKDYDYDSLKETDKEEEQIDDIYLALVIQLQKLFDEKKLDLNHYTKTLTLIKCFERIGDYIQKIAHIVYYIESGSNKDFS